MYLRLQMHSASCRLEQLGIFYRVEYRDTQLGIHADKINFRRRCTYIYTHMHISFFPSALRIIRREFIREFVAAEYYTPELRGKMGFLIIPRRVIFQERSNFTAASAFELRVNVATLAIIYLFGHRLRATSFREEERRTKFTSISSIRIRCFFLPSKLKFLICLSPHRDQTNYE